VTDECGLKAKTVILDQRTGTILLFERRLSGEELDEVLTDDCSYMVARDGQVLSSKRVND
jgi:hypothetical protein